MRTTRFLLDRSVGGRLLVARLRSAGWDAVTLAEEFGDERAQRMADAEWIEAGTRAGYVLLAKDHRIASRPLESLAVHVHDARVVTFARGELTAAQMGDLCLRYEDAIHRLARVQPPFVMALNDAGLRRKRLNLPD